MKIKIARGLTLLSLVFSCYCTTVECLTQTEGHNCAWFSVPEQPHLSILQDSTFRIILDEPLLVQSIQNAGAANIQLSSPTSQVDFGNYPITDSDTEDNQGERLDILFRVEQLLPLKGTLASLQIAADGRSVTIPNIKIKQLKNIAHTRTYGNTTPMGWTGWWRQTAVPNLIGMQYVSGLSLVSYANYYSITNTNGSLMPSAGAMNTGSGACVGATAKAALLTLCYIDKPGNPSSQQLSITNSQSSLPTNLMTLNGLHSIVSADPNGSLFLTADDNGVLAYDFSLPKDGNVVSFSRESSVPVSAIKVMAAGDLDGDGTADAVIIKNQVSSVYAVDVLRGSFPSGKPSLVYDSKLSAALTTRLATSKPTNIFVTWITDLTGSGGKQWVVLGNAGDSGALTLWVAYMPADSTATQLLSVPLEQFQIDQKFLSADLTTVSGIAYLLVTAGKQNDDRSAISSDTYFYQIGEM